jgi:hypothetical protein
MPSKSAFKNKFDHKRIHVVNQSPKFFSPLQMARNPTNNKRSKSPTAKSNSREIQSLRNWVVNLDGSITGVAYGGPKNRKGDAIQTSQITAQRDSFKEGDIVTTISGSKYQLGIKRKAQFPPKPPPLSTLHSSEAAAEEKISASKGSLFSTLTKREKNPALFANILFQKKSDETSDVKIPVLDNWSINFRGQIVGIICNSPFPRETDGKSVTTKPIETHVAFIVEGFTVDANDGRKYKLGIPKEKNVLMNNNSNSDNVVVYRTPTLVDWDVEDGNAGNMIQIVGTMKGTNNPKIPNGQIITTDKIITSSEFLAEGYSVVTARGETYKLGRRNRTGAKRRQGEKATVIPAAATTKLSTATRLSLSSQKKQKETKKLLFQRSKVNTPLINEWCVTGTGGIKGIVSNSQDPNIKDGDTLTTGKIITEDISEGQVVETINRSVYIIGTRSKQSMNSSPLESPETLVTLGLWVTAGLLVLILNRGMY